MLARIISTLDRRLSPITQTIMREFGLMAVDIRALAAQARLSTSDG
jgi:hypothetical protein